MTRSTGLNTNPLVGAITKVIAARSRTYQVRRPTEHVGSLDEVTDTTTEHPEYIYLFESSEQVSDEITGARVDGDLGGLVVADGAVDIQYGDYVDYGGITYQVETVVGMPDDSDMDATVDSERTRYWNLGLVRTQQ